MRRRRVADKRHMINAVTARNTYIQQSSQLAANAHARPEAAQKTSVREDTVQLSSAAKAALGDVDHDGDSH